MAANHLRANVRHLPGITIIDLYGDIDGDAKTVLENAYIKAEGKDPTVIVLNFADVGFVNSKGIALIVILLRQAIGSDRRLLACGLSEHYQEMFDITRLSDYITICTDEEGALSEVPLSDIILQASSG